MANAIIGGLLKNGFLPQNIVVSEPVKVLSDSLKEKFNIIIAENNSSAVQSLSSSTDVLVFAVKPQVMKVVAEEVAAEIANRKPLVISIAAGITLTDLSKWLSAGNNITPQIVRCMPNTPALVNEGATGLYASENVTAEQKKVTENVLGSVSAKTYWVDKENLLDIVTGLSGSGPAYFFYLLEHIEQAAVDLGLPRDVARGLATQTCLGAGKMAVSTGEDPKELRRKVTSPNGTTEAGIKSLDQSGAGDILKGAVIAATQRSEELGILLGKQ
ncbi:hypothetical protein HK098_000968 [Nowakowskiella sp. JEL0407]|nr:hypothetical protein HK098_000968 [Nowakowskiella sp. JEL0407]